MTTQRYNLVSRNSLPKHRKWCCIFVHFSSTPHFNVEPDYIVRKPMKHRFQRYIVRTEIFATFHAQVEYISGKNM